MNGEQANGVDGTSGKLVEALRNRGHVAVRVASGACVKGEGDTGSPCPEQRFGGGSMKAWAPLTGEGGAVARERC